MAYIQPLTSLYCTLRIEVCNWWGWGQWLALGAALPLRAQCQSRPPRFRLPLLVLVVGGFVSTLRPRVSAALGHRFGVAIVECCSLYRLWGCFRWLRSLASSGFAPSPLPLVGGVARPVTALARHKLPRSGTPLEVK